MAAADIAGYRVIVLASEWQCWLHLTARKVRAELRARDKMQNRISIMQKLYEDFDVASTFGIVFTGVIATFRHSLLPFAPNYAKFFLRRACATFSASSALDEFHMSLVYPIDALALVQTTNVTIRNTVIRLIANTPSRICWFFSGFTLCINIELIKRV